MRLSKERLNWQLATGPVCPAILSAEGEWWWSRPIPAALFDGNDKKGDAIHRRGLVVRRASKRGAITG